MTLYPSPLYSALLSLVVIGPGAGATPFEAVQLFLRQAAGGIALGGMLGLAFVAMTSFIDDHLLEMTLSTALAYGSYFAAQSAGLSGAIACVAAGLVHGSLGRASMSEANRRLLDNLWEYFAFLANAIVFLLLGLTVDLADLSRHAPAVLAAVLAALVARVVVIDGLRLVAGAGVAMSAVERLILTWGGLRGALTAALALALPSTVPARDVLVPMAFGVVLFTLIVQGGTLPLLLRRLPVAGPLSKPGGT